MRQESKTRVWVAIALIVFAGGVYMLWRSRSTHISVKSFCGDVEVPGQDLCWKERYYTNIHSRVKCVAVGGVWETHAGAWEIFEACYVRD